MSGRRSLISSISSNPASAAKGRPYISHHMRFCSLSIQVNTYMGASVLLLHLKSIVPVFMVASSPPGT